MNTQTENKSKKNMFGKRTTILVLSVLLMAVIAFFASQQFIGTSAEAAAPKYTVSMNGAVVDKPWKVLFGSDEAIKSVIVYDHKLYFLSVDADITSADVHVDGKYEKDAGKEWTTIYGDSSDMRGVVEMGGKKFLTSTKDIEQTTNCCEGKQCGTTETTITITKTTPTPETGTPTTSTGTPTTSTGTPTTSTGTPNPTKTPEPTKTVEPTKTPEPTKTAEPTKQHCDNGLGTGSDCPPPGHDKNGDGIADDPKGDNDNDTGTRDCGTQGKPCNNKHNDTTTSGDQTTGGDKTTDGTKDTGKDGTKDTGKDGTKDTGKGKGKTSMNTSEWFFIAYPAKTSYLVSL